MYLRAGKRRRGLAEDTESGIPTAGTQAIVITPPSITTEEPSSGGWDSLTETEKRRASQGAGAGLVVGGVLGYLFGRKN